MLRRDRCSHRCRWRAFAFRTSSYWCNSSAQMPTKCSSAQPPTILQPPKSQSPSTKQTSKKPITMNVLQSALRRTTPMAARRFASAPAALPKAPVPVRCLLYLSQSWWCHRRRRRMLRVACCLDVCFRELTHRRLLCLNPSAGSLPIQREESIPQ